MSRKSRAATSMGMSTSIVSFTSLPPSSTKLIAPLVDISALPFALSAAIRRSQLCRVGWSRHTSDFLLRFRFDPKEIRYAFSNEVALEVDRAMRAGVLGQ